MFIFDGGILSDRQIAILRPMDDELLACRFYSLAAARGLLRPYVYEPVDAGAPRRRSRGTEISARRRRA